MNDVEVYQIDQATGRKRKWRSHHCLGCKVEIDRRSRDNLCINCRGKQLVLHRIKEARLRLIKERENTTQHHRTGRKNTEVNYHQTGFGISLSIAQAFKLDVDPWTFVGEKQK